MNTRWITIVLIGLVMLAPAALAKSAIRQARASMMAVKKGPMPASMTSKAAEMMGNKATDEKLTGRAKALSVGQGRKLGLEKQVGNKSHKEPNKAASKRSEDYSLKSRERYDMPFGSSTGRKGRLTTVGNPAAIP